MDYLKKQIDAIAHLSEPSWEVLNTCLTEMELKRNHYLLKEGQVCKSIYFICSGFCKSVYNLDGKEVNTAFYFEGEFATNIKSLTAGIKSEYNIRTCERAHVIRFDKDKLIEAYSRSHQIETFGRKVLELIIARQEDETNSFKLLSPQQRYENLILKYPDFLQRVSLTQLASYLGMSRETLSRIRARY